MGRPSKLTPEMQEQVVQYVRDTVPLSAAAAAVGVTARSLEHWMAWGEKADDEWEGEQEPEAGTYASFFREVRRAKALSLIDAIKDAKAGDGVGVGNGKSKCAQWVLERTDKRFSPRIAVKVEQEMDVMIDVLAAVLPPEMYADVLAALSEVDDDGVPRILSAPVDAETATTH